VKAREFPESFVKIRVPSRISFSPIEESLLFNQIRLILHYRHAIRNIAVRDLKVRYSNSALGIVWSFFNPLLMTLVYTVVFTFMLRDSGIPKYPVYILAGVLPWSFFNLATLGAISVVTANGHLIGRLYFPREILPIAIVASNAINFLIALVLLFAFIVIYQVPLTLYVLWLPVIILIQIVLSVGVALFLSAIHVFFRDTQQIMEVLLLAWFFVTPILYPLERIRPVTRPFVLLLNPLAALIGTTATSCTRARLRTSACSPPRLSRPCWR
jgi:lipopolysaccharide transport system permease protein